MDNCCRCVCVWDTLPAACLGSCLWLGKGKRSAVLHSRFISVLVELVADLLNLKFDSLSAASQNDSWDESRLYFHSISVSLLIHFKAKIKLRSDSKWFFAPAHTKIKWCDKCWTFHRESEDELGNILGPKLPFFVIVSLLVLQQVICRERALTCWSVTLKLLVQFVFDHFAVFHEEELVNKV